MATEYLVASAEQTNKAVLWEKDLRHPGGEAYIIGDGRAVRVGDTLKVRGLIAGGVLLVRETFEVADAPGALPAPGGELGALQVEHLTANFTLGEATRELRRYEEARAEALRWLAASTLDSDMQEGAQHQVRLAIAERHLPALSRAVDEARAKCGLLSNRIDTMQNLVSRLRGWMREFNAGRTPRAEGNGNEYAILTFGSDELVADAAIDRRKVEAALIRLTGSTDV
jgi:hypothetical protein